MPDFLLYGFLRRRAALAGLAVATSVGLALDAAASETYPGVLERHTGVECPRPLTRCLICHDTAAGGEETANKPFADTLRMFGLEGGKSPRGLASALDNIPADYDTDKDGDYDLVELAECHNPSGTELSEGPGYGCNGAAIAAEPGGAKSAWPLCAALLCGAVLRLRTRRAEQQAASGVRRGAGGCLLLALGVGACKPTQILEEQYPSRLRTCYDFPGSRDAGAPAQTSFWSGTQRPGDCDQALSAGGGAGIAGVGGSSASAGGAGGRGGSGGVLGGSSSGAGGALGGAGGALAQAGAPSSEGPDAGMLGSGGSASVPALAAACADTKARRGTIPGFTEAADNTAVVLALLRSPLTTGGCQDDEFGGCHGQTELGPPELPDFKAPGVVQALLGGTRPRTSDGRGCDRAWITPGQDESQSFLWHKLTDGSALDCGDPMPLDPAEPLKTEDLECIRTWIRQVAGVP